MERTNRGSKTARPKCWVVGLIGLTWCIGCGRDDGLGRRAMSGVATLDGRPLAAGSILFDPASDRVGTAVGTLIRAGRFSLPRSSGAVPGIYVVRIYASSSIQSPPPAGLSERAARPMVELIPARYNSLSTIRAEVTSQGRNEFRFAMLSGLPTAPAAGQGAQSRTTP